MADIVRPEERSRIMSRIKGRDTTPELRLRKALHALGLRYRLHVKGLPGRPDIVFPQYRVVLFVHGCFWHRHGGCKYCYTPKSRVEFWEAKFEATALRDFRNTADLVGDGWRVFVVWECGLRPKDGPMRIGSGVANALKIEKVELEFV